MFKIGYDKKITMVQGDTGVIRMKISNHELSQGDEVRFAIVNKANPSILLCQHSDKKIVLEKQVTVFEKDGSARIVIYPYDTEYLQPGKYLYEIQVKTKDSRVDTVVSLTSFTLMDGSIQGEYGQTTPSKPEPTPSEIELRFKRLENEIIPELGNRITNVENEIDSISSSLDDKASLNLFGYSKITIKNKLNPPNNFDWNNAPINIYKAYNGEITHDLDIKKYEYKGKTYYVNIETGLGDNDGLTEDTPLPNIQSAINKTDCEVVIICGGIYYHNKGYGSTGISVDKKLTIKAKEDTKPIIRACQTDFSYSLVDGTTYTTTRSGVGRVFDASRIDDNGDYLELTKKSTLNEVKTNHNTYFISGSEVYVNTIDGRIPDNNILLLFDNMNTITATANLYIEGIEIQGGKNCLVTSSNNKNECFVNNCTFKYSTYDDGLQAKFKTTIVSNCLAAKNAQDGFSYSANNVIEVNCIGRDNGDPNDKDLANTQNGSTQHNGGKVIRVNNEYYRNKGSNCGDNHTGTKSWNLGCLAYESKSTENRYNSNFTAHNGTEMWLDSCVSYNSENDNCIQDGSTMYLNYELFLCKSTYLEGTGKVEKY